MVFPDCVNENTGMLVLIPGYGGNIDSHVFRKMREVFAEQYNFITVQCDYFGNRFMDSNEPEEMRLCMQCSLQDSPMSLFFSCGNLLYQS